MPARRRFSPPELKICREVTATLGRNPFGTEAVPTSVQLAVPVLLAKTPTSVPTYTIPFESEAPESTMITFAGASGRLAVKSVHDPPASVVFQTCEVWNPMMVT